MKLITSNDDLTKQFNLLLEKHSEYYFATAWAGVPENVFSNLVRNVNKIRKFIVGIHFYQTDPKFFFEFLENKNVRTILQPNGTFHPKVFLFYTNENKWTLLTGSSNFTNAAFKKNTEAVFMIDSSEADIEILRSTESLISYNWDRAQIVDKTFYADYLIKWNKMRLIRNQLTEAIDEQNISNKEIPEIMKLSWKDYVSRFEENREIVEGRFIMLETIRNIFASGKSLIEMSSDERKFICGNPNDLTLLGAERYAEFGTSGNGQFMNKMINGNIHISNALERIPLTGNVSKENFDDFVRDFLKDKDATDGWVSSAGRLLAMKRPDVFYNITNGNRRSFCSEFGNTETHTKQLRNYWTLVVEKVQSCKWYYEYKPKNAYERQLVNARAAMLDVLYYFGDM